MPSLQLVNGIRSKARLSNDTPLDNLSKDELSRPNCDQIWMTLAHCYSSRMKDPCHQPSVSDMPMPIREEGGSERDWQTVHLVVERVEMIMQNKIRA